MIKFIIKAFSITLLYSVVWAETPDFFEDTGVIPIEEAFDFSYELDGGKVSLKWDIFETCYLYRDRISIVTEDIDATISELKLPSGKEKNDPNFGLVEVFNNSLEGSFTYSSEKPFSLKVKYQGCDEKTGVCYTPVTKVLNLPPAKAIGGPTLGEVIQNGDVESFIALLSSSDSVVGGIIFFFIAGLLLGFSPCVYPMVPILASMLSASSRRTRRNFITAVLYILGVSFVFALLGILSASIGKTLSNYFQQWFFLLPAAVIVSFFALTLFDLVSISVPGANKINKAMNSLNRDSIGKWFFAFSAGALSALVLSPCVTPPMVAAIIFIAEKGDLVFGAMALFTLGIGMGIPLLAVALGFGYILPKSGGWLGEMKIILGVLLLALAVSLIDRFSYEWVGNMLYTAIIVTYCNHIYLRFGNHPSHKVTLLVRSTLSLIVLSVIVWLVNSVSLPQHSGSMSVKDQHDGSSSSGFSYHSLPTVTTPETLLAELTHNDDKDVLIFVHAEWCVSCVENEKFAYSDPKILDVFSKFHLVSFDVTDYNSNTESYLSSQRIVGPPVLVRFPASQIETLGSEPPSLKKLPQMVGLVSVEKVLDFTK